MTRNHFSGNHGVKINAIKEDNANIINYFHYLLLSPHSPNFSIYPFRQAFFFHISIRLCFFDTTFNSLIKFNTHVSNLINVELFLIYQDTVHTRCSKCLPPKSRHVRKRSLMDYVDCDTTSNVLGRLSNVPLPSEIPC